MPFVTRTPASSWMDALIRLREQIGHFFVRFGAAVTIELPDISHLANHVEVQIGDDDRVLVTRTFGHDLAAWIREITLPVKLTETPRLLHPNAVDRPDVKYIGDRRGRLLQLPQVFAEPGDCGAGIEYDFRAVEPEQTPAFGKMPVVTDVDAHFADRRLEHRIAEIARLEVKLLPEAGFTMRDVVLAVFAEEFAVGIDHSRCVVIGARSLFFVDRHHDHHAVLFSELLHQLRRRTVRHALRRFIPFDFLFAAEVRTVENFLHAQHLHAFFRRLRDEQ